MRNPGFCAALVLAAASCLAQAPEASAWASEAGVAVAPIEGQAVLQLLSPGAPASSRAALKRYTKTLMAAYVEYYPDTCAQVSSGAWTVTLNPKHGETSTGTLSGHLGNGDCPGNTYTFAAIYYKWMQHDNKTVTDVFNATWKTPDGQFNFPFVFNITVPIVRPIGEMTMFTGWQETRGLWMQTLEPPIDDPGFDFSGEQVQEAQVGGTDACFNGSLSMAQLSGGPWTVQSGNTWGPDGVGWGSNTSECVIEYYRCLRRTPCGFSLLQQMSISSPADHGNFVNYGAVNNLRANIEGFTINKQGYGNVTSQRAGGGSQPKFFLSSPLNCPKTVDLSKCP